jgi:hypothetical protein
VEELTLAKKPLLSSQPHQMKLGLEQRLRLVKGSASVVTLGQTAVNRVSRVGALQQQRMAFSLQQPFAEALCNSRTNKHSKMLKQPSQQLSKKILAVANTAMNR